MMDTQPIEPQVFVFTVDLYDPRDVPSEAPEVEAFAPAQTAYETPPGAIIIPWEPLQARLLWPGCCRSSGLA